MDEEYQEIAIPIQQLTDNQLLSSPELITYYNNIDNRLLWIDTEIGVDTLEVVKKIIEWNRDDFKIPIEERTPIKLFFFTYGGRLDVTNMLIDVIIGSKTPVYGYNCGVAYSGGALIYMACHQKYALSHSSFMLHKGNGSFEGITADVNAGIADYARMISEMIDFVSEKVHMNKKTVREKMNHDWYITANDAMSKYKFVDAIIDNLDDIFVKG